MNEMIDKVCIVNIHAELLCEIRQNEFLEEMNRIRLLKESVKGKTLWD